MNYAFCAYFVQIKPLFARFLRGVPDVARRERAPGGGGRPPERTRGDQQRPNGQLAARPLSPGAARKCSPLALPEGHAKTAESRTPVGFSCRSGRCLIRKRSPPWGRAIASAFAGAGGSGAAADVVEEVLHTASRGGMQRFASR